MCVCSYMYMCFCTGVCVLVCVCAGVCVLVCVCWYVCVLVCTVHVCVHEGVSPGMCVCVHVGVCWCVCVYLSVRVCVWYGLCCLCYMYVLIVQHVCILHPFTSPLQFTNCLLSICTVHGVYMYVHVWTAHVFAVRCPLHSHTVYADSRL